VKNNSTGRLQSNSLLLRSDCLAKLLIDRKEEGCATRLSHALYLYHFSG